MPKRATVELATFLKVLGDPSRLAIFDLLMQGVQCNCEIGGNLKMPMNLISHHLKVLRDAGLVVAERDATDGRWIYYLVNHETLSAFRKELGVFLDPERIQPRKPACGPRRVSNSTPVAQRLLK
ncbi:MAG: winged helix-turn-helix transcriptional regulator [Chloroflexota bacterium]|nr:winged helix-turn-helix transcriptional regulator [Chloroflexota bacterium]